MHRDDYQFELKVERRTFETNKVSTFSCYLDRFNQILKIFNIFT